MTNLKYEFVEDDTLNFANNTKLKRIRSLVTIERFGVKPGDLGGYIESESNLTTHGDAWVSGCAWVYGKSFVFADGLVTDYACLHGEVQVFGNARIFGNAHIYGSAKISRNAKIYGDARVFGDANISGNARVSLTKHAGCFVCVGSEGGTLTWWRDEKEIHVSRGCFNGTLDEFEAAVKKTHAGTRYAEEYQHLIEFTRLRSADFSWNDGEDA